MREADVIKLLQQKYTKVRPGTNADRFVRAAHVRRPTGYGHAAAIADYLVQDTYQPFDLLGFEVKVSRSDWLTELKNPRKSWHWQRYCNRWYLAASDAKIVKDDLPEGWGLLLPTKSGLRVAVQAPYVESPEGMPASVRALWGRSVAKTARLERGV